MPAAASVVAANFIYNQAPRDGTVIGSFSRNLASQARMGLPNIEVDPRRFNWLGGYSLPSRICVNWHTSPVKTIDDLFTREMITAGGGATSSLSIIPTVLNHVLGTKFRIVEGYKGIRRCGAGDRARRGRGCVHVLCPVQRLPVPRPRR